MKGAWRRRPRHLPRAASHSKGIMLRCFSAYALGWLFYKEAFNLALLGLNRNSSEEPR